MEHFLLEEFQCMVEELLCRNGNLLDLITKLGMSNDKLCRAAAKAITQCGCVRFEVDRESTGKRSSKERSGICGELCDACREELEKEAGEHLFYLSGFLNAAGLDLYDVYLKEMNRQRMLGKYGLR